jgi:hypothetical protein
MAADLIENHDYGRFSAEALYELKPILDIGVLIALPAAQNDEIETAFCEKELVRRPWVSKLKSATKSTKQLGKNQSMAPRSGPAGIAIVEDQSHPAPMVLEGAARGTAGKLWPTAHCRAVPWKRERQRRAGCRGDTQGVD